MSALQMLLSAFPDSISGELIASTLNISRSAIWKQMQTLQKLGLQIEGKRNSGYRLLAWPDLLLPEIIQYYRSGTLGQEVLWREVLPSTNTTAKEIARQGADHGTLVVTEEQTAGRGRRGRSWNSERGSGIFASLILRPELPTRVVPMLTLAVGIALVEALHYFGLNNAWLKWPNDVWVGERKLAGILSELSGELDRVDFVVIGMGINTNQAEFPEWLASTATSIYRETGLKQNRGELLARILVELEKVLPLLELAEPDSLVQAWQKHDRLLGRQVNVIEPTDSYTGTALGLGSSGALRIAMPDGSEKLVMAGDVSIRPHTVDPTDATT